MNQTRFIVAGSLIDGSGIGVRRNVFVAVKTGLITAIGSAAADLPSHGPATIDDFSHCTILPALIDCSVCLSRSPAVDMEGWLSTGKSGLADPAARRERHIRYCHAHGVLGVADNGEPTGSGESRQEGRAPGTLIAIRSSGRLCRSRQDCSADSPGAGEFLKIGYSADIEDEETPQPRLDNDDLCRLLARRGEKKTVVVANGRQQVGEALAAGCDAIEQGYAMGEDNLREMARKNVLWIPSVLRARNALDSASSGGDVGCRFSLRYLARGNRSPAPKLFGKSGSRNSWRN